MMSEDPRRKQLQKKIREKLRDGSGGHDFDHTLRVLHNALKLAEATPGADTEILFCAALAHDFARPEETAANGKICHAALGAKLAPELLESCGFSPELAKKAAECVRTHRYRDQEPPQSIEAKILYDADKLDALGATGLGRAFLFAGHIGARLHNTSEEALSSPPYSREDTAYREYLVKLRKLPDCMQTAAGKKLAEDRLQFMTVFFERLSQECFS